MVSLASEALGQPPTPNPAHGHLPPTLNYSAALVSELGLLLLLSCCFRNATLSHLAPLSLPPSSFDMTHAAVLRTPQQRTMHLAAGRLAATQVNAGHGSSYPTPAPTPPPMQLVVATRSCVDTGVDQAYVPDATVHAMHLAHLGHTHGSALPTPSRSPAILIVPRASGAALARLKSSLKPHCRDVGKL